MALPQRTGYTFDPSTRSWIRNTPRAPALDVLRAELEAVNANLDAKLAEHEARTRAISAQQEWIRGNMATFAGGRPGAEQVAKWLGTSVGRIDRYAQVAGYRSDGKFVLVDGSVVTREELLAKQ